MLPVNMTSTSRVPPVVIIPSQAGGTTTGGGVEGSRAASSALIGIGYSVLLLGDSAWIYGLSIVVWTVGEIGNTPTSIALV